MSPPMDVPPGCRSKEKRPEIDPRSSFLDQLRSLEDSVLKLFGLTSDHERPTLDPEFTINSNISARLSAIIVASIHQFMAIIIEYD